MNSDELNFDLPPDLIAQSPPPQRESSRLLCYNRANRSIAHSTFSDLPQRLQPGDLLVFNDARVLPARFLLRKKSGGAIDGLFLAQPEPGIWSVLLRNLGDAPLGTILSFSNAPEIHAKILQRHDPGEYRIAVDSAEPAGALLERLGRMPLPPYIKREKEIDPRDAADRERYQTVYAKSAGSVAAPTAGLHFTGPILEQLDKHGIDRVFVTLHVGMGTFKPVTADRLEDHRMHSERYSINAEAAEKLNRAQSTGKRIIAVGTTAARVLESWPADQPWKQADEQTSIFIYPPYPWKRVAALLTNFHLPRSTLIALVAAFVGTDEQRRLYSIAIEQRYRFFSYGDAMLLQ